MKLIYCYIKNFRNITEQEILFSTEFRVRLNEKGLFIYRTPKNKSSDLLYQNSVLKNVHIIAGKTGSGKTNIMQLISIGAAERVRLKEPAEYLFVYHDMDNRFALESSGISIPNLSETEKRYAYHIPRGYQFVVNDACLADEFGPLDDNTVIFNGFDKFSLSNTVYTDDRTERFADSEHSLRRVRAAYQNTDLFFVCKYLDRYIRTFSDDSIKKKASLVIRCTNWSENFDDFLPEKLLRSDYKTYGQYHLGERLLTPVAQPHISAKNRFIHDLMIDYALFLRGTIERNNLYRHNNPSVLGAGKGRKKYCKIGKSFEDVSNLPDYKKMGPLKRIRQLAAYIDNLASPTDGSVRKTAVNIARIKKALMAFDDKYFTPDKFEIPICELFTEDNETITDDLFYNMEQYDVPVNTGVFEKELLPYKLTCISSGECQLARVLGGIEKYCMDMNIGAVNHDLIYTLDEPEVYMHPELCRCFLKRLAEILDTQAEEKSIQIILSTHSPFMLSDILPEQMTRLNLTDDGYCEIINGSDKRYFGANIHTIMADGFFLRYTIGEFSRITLQKMLDELRDIAQHPSTLSDGEKQRIEEIKECLPEIGDDLIRSSFHVILEMFE